MHTILFIQGAGAGAYTMDALLAESLQLALGPSYQVHYPEMPNEAAPSYPSWRDAISAEIAALEGQVILVGHSFGGSVLIKYLCDQPEPPLTAGLFLIAAPFWGKDEGWQYEEVHLPGDADARLAQIPHIAIYHSQADETIPFSHHQFYKDALPQAAMRDYPDRDHQFNNNLGVVADDIRGLAA